MAKNGKDKNAYTNLARKPIGKQQPGRPRSWKDNIKT
jgi:hypothetical protein